MLYAGAQVQREKKEGTTSHAPTDRWVLVHVVMHGEDVVEVFLVGIDVDHPAEDDGVEATAGVGASLLGGDGTVEAELGPVGALKLIALGHAEICVQVPHGDAEGDAGVELVIGGAFGHGVHGAD